MERRLKGINSLFLIAVQLFVLTSVAAVAGNTDYMLPETVEIRREFLNIITGTNNEIKLQQDVVSDCYLTGKKVKFQVISNDDFFYFIFINEKTTRNGSDYPLVSPGTYIIKRSASSGALEQIKIFLNNDPETFVRITSRGGDSLLEFSLFGSMVCRDVLLPVTVESLLAEPFETIVVLSDYIVDWNMLSEDYNETENRTMIKICYEIEQKLHLLKDSDDGAQDSSGDFVLIDSMKTNPAQGFNCSGFIKWISDGIYSAKTSRLMDIDELKRKNFKDRRDTLSLLYEDMRDPLFGLDWTRNIALTLFELGHTGAPVSVQDIDVRNYPYEPYTPDIGYPVSNLKAVLYYLAVTDPGYIYLGSINGDYGTEPVLRQHYHVAAFLPYVSPDGSFHPVVFERNRKTPVDDFIRTYSRESVHLVRVKAENSFARPPIPPPPAE